MALKVFVWYWRFSSGLKLIFPLCKKKKLNSCWPQQDRAKFESEIVNASMLNPTFQMSEVQFAPYPLPVLLVFMFQTPRETVRFTEGMKGAITR